MEFLSRIGAVDALRPTFFELVDEETLIGMVKPALKTVLSVYAPRYPAYLLPAYNRFEELYALVTLAIEKYYLDTCDGSFGDNFYGLKRTVVVTSSASRPLRARDRYAALAFLVLVPYVQAKLEAVYERNATPFGAAQEAEEGNEEGDRVDRLKRLIGRLFLRYYPYAKAFVGTVVFAYQVAYLYGLTRYYSPWLHLLRQEIKRLSLVDTRKLASKTENYAKVINAKYPGDSLAMIIRRQGLLTLQTLLSSLQTVLPTAIFFYKFLQWWFASGYAKSSANGAAVVPPPPAPLPKVEGGLDLPASKAVCPICLKDRTNATVIPSGYVFCYPCIFKHVQENGMCPVTLRPTSIDQLRKIYVSS